MNLKDLERKKQEVGKKKHENGLYFPPEVNVYKKQEEVLDKLIGIFSQETSVPSSTGIEVYFSKIYGFQKQKAELTQILRAQLYLSSRISNNDFSNKILCFVGPPGVGKTVFAKTIAKTLGKGFYIIPLAGKSEPWFLLGDFPTYQAASYGQMIEAFLQTRSPDPVILFDEVDKAGSGKYGDIKHVLLQILDPNQNKQFKDQYLDAETDLSQITFVLTANSVDDLDPALKSRLEIIQLEGYSPQDKKHIAKLILEELFEKANYLNSGQLEISDAAWEKLISLTNEEGVRQLKQGINKILIYCYDKWAEDYNNNHSPRKILIDPAKIEEIIPEEFFAIDKQEQKRLKEEKEREELINLDKQWRNNQRQFQNRLLIILGIGIFLLMVLTVVLILKNKKKIKNT